MVATAKAPRNGKPVASKSSKQGASSEIEALRADLTINRAMAENSPINILLADRDLKIIYANPASLKTLKTIEKYLPVRAEEVVGQSIDAFHKQPEHQTVDETQTNSSGDRGRIGGGLALCNCWIHHTIIHRHPHSSSPPTPSPPCPPPPACVPLHTSVKSRR